MTDEAMSKKWIIDKTEPVLVTGSAGFIGSRVVKTLLELGFSHVRGFVRPSSKRERLESVLADYPHANVEILSGNLLSREDCQRAVAGVRVIWHLAAGIDKSFSGAFMNSVVTTRNLLDAALEEGLLKRFVNVSSFAVYDTRKLKRGALLDESCPLEAPPHARGEAYTYAKIKQDEVVFDYSRQHRLPFVILRPGAVYGPGKRALTGRVGIDTFGTYLHLGGSNRIPLSYVDNCAEAMVLAGLVRGVDGEVFNVVDDDLPRSRGLLRAYKRNVSRFVSVPVPYPLTYLLCSLWEWYSEWSEGQLPPAFNRSRCVSQWKGMAYSNGKLKSLLGWRQRVPAQEALKRYFEYQKQAAQTS